jgi:3',5'-cyclic-AMP phosphodiesterase
VNQAHQVGGALFAMCDSTIPGESRGLLSDETLAWLDATLGQAPPHAPVFVGFHHPPVDLHVPFMDSMRQIGEDRLAKVLAGHRNVAALLCGHAHTPAVTTFAGLPLVVAPSLISTIVLPWDGAGVVNQEPPAALAFHLFDDGRLTTHFRTVR